MLAANAVFELARDIEYLSRDGDFGKAAVLIPILKAKIKEIAQDLTLLRAEAEKIV